MAWSGEEASDEGTEAKRRLLLDPSTVERPPPDLPAVPTMRARPSYVFITLGNAFLLIVAYLYVTDVMPMRWVLLSLGAAIFPMFWFGGRNEETIKIRFTEKRLPEILSFFEDEGEAISQVQKDFKGSINTSESINVIAIPMLMVTLILFVLFFYDVNASIKDWIWIVRWPAAFICALAATMLPLLVWISSNLTPAVIEINYQELRTQGQHFSQLGQEDQNDAHIISEMTNLQSLHRRVETYTLESALLSALSFSSFLAIILSERSDYLAQIHQMFPVELSWYALPRLPPLSWFNFDAEYPWIRSEWLRGNIMGLICLSLLLCAATFLGALIGRLRFNDGFRDAESLLKAAERINDKEDDAIVRGDRAKAAVYASAINDMLDKAEELQRGMALTVLHMRLSRNAGVLFFIIALVLCGTFFHEVVAAVIALLFVGAFLVGYCDSFLRGLARKRAFGEVGLASLLRPFGRRSKAS